MPNDIAVELARLPNDAAVAALARVHPLILLRALAASKFQDRNGKPAVVNADLVAGELLGRHCACYAEAFPAVTCDNERAEVARVIEAAMALVGAVRDTRIAELERELDHLHAYVSGHPA